MWTDECDAAFTGLKDALCNAPVLYLPDFKRPFEVICDASGVGLGAVLVQDGRPLAFWGKHLTEAEQKYGVGEQEMLAVVHALELWRCYLAEPLCGIYMHLAWLFVQTCLLVRHSQSGKEGCLGCFSYQVYVSSESALSSVFHLHGSSVSMCAKSIGTELSKGASCDSWSCGKACMSVSYPQKCSFVSSSSLRVRPPPPIAAVHFTCPVALRTGVACIAKEDTEQEVSMENTIKHQHSACCLGWDLGRHLLLSVFNPALPICVTILDSAVSKFLFYFQDVACRRNTSPQACLQWISSVEFGIHYIVPAISVVCH